MAKVVYSEFEPSDVQKVLTMEVATVCRSPSRSDEFNVGVAIAKTERDPAAEEFYEQRMVQTPRTRSNTSTSPRARSKKRRARPTVDTYQVGVTLDALVRLAEKARAKP